MTTAIDKCAQIVDETITALEKLRTFILEARAMAPDQVDGCKLLDLEGEAGRAMEGMDSALCGSFFDDLPYKLTGKRSYYWCLKHDILDNENFNRPFVEREIDSLRKDDPAIADELQALLNARQEVQHV